MRITDLDKFAIEHLYRPYCSTLNPEIWELEYTQNDRIAANKLRLQDESKIKKDLCVLIKWFEEDKDFKECIFKRLKAIDKTDKFIFPEYIQHPLKDYVIKQLEDKK